MTKKAIRKKIIEKCKKLTKCPYCKETNGFVKKLTASKGSTGGSVLKIVCEKNRGSDKETILKEQLGIILKHQKKWLIYVIISFRKV